MAEMRPNVFPQSKLEPEPQLSAPLQPQQRPSTSAVPSSSSREYELLFLVLYMYFNHFPLWVLIISPCYLKILDFKSSFACSLTVLIHFPFWVLIKAEFLNKI